MADTSRPAKRSRVLSLSSTSSMMDQPDPPSVLLRSRIARKMEHVETPPERLDLGYLSRLIFEVDHNVTRLPINLHPPIFETMEDSLAFVYSLLIYAKETEPMDMIHLRCKSQTARLEEKNWNWLIRKSPYFLLPTRTIPYLGLSRANVFGRVMATDQTLVVPGNDKYLLTSLICYVLMVERNVRESRFRFQIILRRDMDLGWGCTRISRYLKKVWKLVISFDHPEVREHMRITAANFPGAEDIALKKRDDAARVQNTSPPGREKSEVVQRIHNLYRTTSDKLEREGRVLQNWRRKEQKLADQLVNVRRTLEDHEKSYRAIETLFGVVEDIHVVGITSLLEYLEMDDGRTIEEFLETRIAAAKRNLEGVGATLLENVNEGEATEFIVKDSSSSGAVANRIPIPFQLITHMKDGSFEKCGGELLLQNLPEIAGGGSADRSSHTGCIYIWISASFRRNLLKSTNPYASASKIFGGGESATWTMVNFEKYQKIGISVTKYVKPPFPDLNGQELSFISKFPPQNQRTYINASPRWFSGYTTPQRATPGEVYRRLPFQVLGKPFWSKSATWEMVNIQKYPKIDGFLVKARHHGPPRGCLSPFPIPGAWKALLEQLRHLSNIKHFPPQNQRTPLKASPRWFSGYRTPPRATPGGVYGRFPFQVLDKLLPGDSASLVMRTPLKASLRWFSGKTTPPWAPPGGLCGRLPFQVLGKPFWSNFGIVVYFEITTSKPRLNSKFANLMSINPTINQARKLSRSPKRNIRHKSPQLKHIKGLEISQGQQLLIIKPIHLNSGIREVSQTGNEDINLKDLKDISFKGLVHGF
ncbi:unnamed protein product [Orchesella dallaii]|uniref:Uncharacterized protein n=1 Tax=Orchesella dallaii TaxID=48710 RepID=A0ABP1RNT2_9HEXA